MNASTDEPVITVVRGAPTDEELAAVVLVLSAGSRGRSPAERPRSGWSAYARTLHNPGHRGPEAWRLSGRQAR